MSQEKSLMIKNLVPGLTECGKIKIGKKGEWRKSRRGQDFQLPQKLDHFLITTMERGQDGNFVADKELMDSIGDPVTAIPIRLLYNDIELNFQTRYSCYRGIQLICYGDGAEAWALRKEGHRDPVKCPCKLQDPKYNGENKCKINGTLSAIVDGAEIVGGVWKFRTTSYNSVVGIISSLTLIRRISGGYLAGLPLDLTIAPKTVSNPIDGKNQTIYVVNIEFTGSVQALRDEGFKYALEDKKHEFRIEHLEAEAKRLLSPDAAGFNENAEDIKNEFYPQGEDGKRLGEPVETPDLVEPDEGGSDPAGKPADDPPAEDPPPEKPKSRGRGRPAKKAPPADKAPAMTGPDAGPGAGPTQEAAKPAQEAAKPAKEAAQPAQGQEKSGKLSLF